MIPLSSILLDIDDDSFVMKVKNKKMIKDFLIIDCTGKNDSIALKIDNKFFIKKLQTNLTKNEILTLEILSFIKKYNLELNNKFTIFVNAGPGSFSGVRISLAVAKGIQIVKGVNIYSYNNFLLNAAPYLVEKKEIATIQKTNNYYYYCLGTFIKNYNFTTPEKLDLSKLKNKNLLFVIPNEIKDDEIVKNIHFKNIRLAKFNLKNIELLIENNLIENKLIKPLYLS